MSSMDVLIAVGNMLTHASTLDMLKATWLLRKIMTMLKVVLVHKDFRVTLHYTNIL